MTTNPTVPLHHVLEGPGDAPGVVLANSLGTALRVWDDQTPALSSRFRLLRYDHRGHGGSPVPSGPYAIDDLDAELQRRRSWVSCGMRRKTGTPRDARRRHHSGPLVLLLFLRELREEMEEIALAQAYLEQQPG